MILPEVRIVDWRPTKDTLATAPPRNHWWHAALLVDVQGLTTGPLRRGGTTFDVTIDLLDHELVVRAAGGGAHSFPLADGFSVADFDRRLHDALDEFGVDAAIRERPFVYGADMTTPFVGGRWTSIGLTVLPYDTVACAHDPRAALPAFLQSAYEAAAGLAEWEVAALRSAWCPTAEQLKQLAANA
jgi:hypothetical protein